MRYGRIMLDEPVWVEFVMDGWEDEARMLVGPPWQEIVYTGQTIAAKDVRILAPLTPSKVVCVGLNYADHIDEMKHEVVPDDPVIFLKPPTSVIGPGEDIVLPGFSQRVDHEAELAVVIARPMKDVPMEEALDYVLGYTCLNDVTARDIQRKDGQWTRGKGMDTFCPMGPWIVTDVRPEALKIEARVNGQVRQSANTRLLIHSVPKLLSFISQAMTLLPGDVVATGTPAGVGLLAAGDRVSVIIEGVGVLDNPVKG